MYDWAQLYFNEAKKCEKQKIEAENEPSLLNSKSFLLNVEMAGKEFAELCAQKLEKACSIGTDIIYLGILKLIFVEIMRIPLIQGCTKLLEKYQSKQWGGVLNEFLKNIPNFREGLMENSSENSGFNLRPNTVRKTTGKKMEETKKLGLITWLILKGCCFKLVEGPKSFCYFYKQSSALKSSTLFFVHKIRCCNGSNYSKVF